jgi:hypothetical protein
MNDEEDEDEDEDFGSCDNCGCDLLDPWEAEDGLCDQCSWWIEQGEDDDEL